MVAIVNSGDGTFKSLTAEGFAQEVAHFLQQAEADPNKNPLNVDYVVGNHSQNAGNYTLSVTFPANQVRNSTNGKTEYDIPEYLTNLGYVPPTECTFKSSTVAGLLHECLIFMENLEADNVANPTKANKVTGRYDTSARRYIGNLDLEVTAVTDTDGAPKYIAKTYLV